MEIIEGSEETGIIRDNIGGENGEPVQRGKGLALAKQTKARANSHQKLRSHGSMTYDKR